MVKRNRSGWDSERIEMSVRAVALQADTGLGVGARPRSAEREGIGYYGGLDGIRALAIAAVLIYHGGVAWAAGGFLGVEVFFVLSGFLITSLLVAEWRASATIALGAFWARRARRLLPALFCLVAVVGIHAALTADSNPIPGLKGDGIATLFYYGNWHQIATQSNYFAATGPVSPLQHTWSLAIEEQFYIFWPTALLAAIWLTRRALRRPTDRHVLGTLLGLTLIVALFSVLETALLFDGGRGVNRVYYGTDTRAVSLLTGASLAFALAMFRPRAGAPSAGSQTAGPDALGVAALLAAAAVLVIMHFADGAAKWLYPFGMTGLDVAVAVVIAAVVLRPASAVGRIFSVAPARALGQISYGVYLWHFPIFLWLTMASTGLSATPLLMFRLGVTLMISMASYVLIEQPVRRRKLPGWIVRSLAPVAMGGALAALLVAAAAASPPVVSAPLPKPPPALTGTQAACGVLLKDTRGYGLSPPSEAGAAVLQPQWLAAHELKWSAQSRVKFHTCPPKKVLLIGDSLAFSLGLGQMIEEHHYGVEVANAAILGCSFNTGGRIDVSGTWQAPPAGCPSALERWQGIERAFRPDAVMVELGYRDQFDWRRDGRTVHLGQPAFDAAVEAQIQRYVDVLGRGGTPILFLSVPYSQPRPESDGSPSPAGSPARHARINALLREVAARDPAHVQVLNLDRVVSPGNRYQPRINDKLVRFDGIHFTIYGSELAAPTALSTVRSIIAG